jgi:hypothetical protein
MNILQQAGMAVSEEMIEPSEQNHAGGFEDIEIFNLHAELLKLLGARNVFPLPERWLDHPEVPRFIDRFGEILTSRIEATTSLWGFKDPRISAFIPLWTRVFNRSKVVPLYVLAVRDPAAVVQSLEMQYGIRQEVGELIWLQRNCDALSYTGGNVFVAHYEEWFKKGDSLLEALLDYTGLKHAKQRLDLNGIINKRLNRAAFQAPELRNRDVISLYSALKTSTGADFDTAQLMTSVLSCRQSMEGYKGWYMEAARGAAGVHHPDGGAPKVLLRQIEPKLEHITSTTDRIAQALSKPKPDRLDEQLEFIRKRYERSLEQLESVAEERANELDRVTQHYEDLIEKLKSEHNEMLEQLKAAAREREEPLSLDAHRERSIRSLEAKLLEREAALVQAQRASEQLQSEYRQQHESAMREQQALRESSAERIRVLEADIQRRDATQRGFQQQIDLLRLERDSAASRAISLQLYSSVRELERAYTDLLDSIEWRLGNLVVRPLEILRLRWRKVLVTEELSDLLQKARGLSQQRDTALAVHAFRPLRGQLRHGFDALFASRRWTLGSALTKPLLRLRRQDEKSIEVDKVLKLLNEFGGTVEARSRNKTNNDTSVMRERGGLSIPHAQGAPPKSLSQSGGQKTAHARKNTSAADRVSVVMPIFNGEQFVEKAIQSVLSQTHGNWELICVDDDSRDGTPRILEQFAASDRRIQIIRHEVNSGKARARNTGLAKITGGYVFFLDADDWLADDAFETMIDRLRADEADMVFGQIRLVRDDTGETSQGIHEAYQKFLIRAKTPTKQPLLLENAIVCNKLISQNFLKRVGCSHFNERLERFEDTELAMKWYLHDPLISITDKPTYFYRQHSGDLACRSNRKVGGLDSAPFYRLSMALEVIRYQQSKGLFDNRVVLSKVLEVIVSNTAQADSSTRQEMLDLATRCAELLPGAVLLALSPKVRDIFAALRQRRQEQALRLILEIRERTRNLTLQRIFSRRDEHPARTASEQSEHDTRSV